MWIATELLVKGIFGFAAPLLVNTLNLEARGAQMITQWFAEHLDRAIQERQRRQQTRRSHLIADPDELPDEDDNDKEDGESTNGTEARRRRQALHPPGEPYTPR